MNTRHFAQYAGGFINSRLSDSPLHYAVDFEANYRDGSTWKIRGFSSSHEEAKGAVARTAVSDEAFTGNENGRHVASVLHRNTKSEDILVRRGRVVGAFVNRDDVNPDSVWP
jgi:hypothetical protein